MCSMDGNRSRAALLSVMMLLGMHSVGRGAPALLRLLLRFGTRGADYSPAT